MPTIEEKIAAARERTRALLAQTSLGPNTQVLPSVHKIILDKEKEETKPLINNPENMEITINGNKFNPYFIDGVGFLNEQQRMAVDWFGLQGKSGCLIGPAGTGKTTTQKAIIRAMILSGRIPILPNDTAHKYLRDGTPGIYGGSFTRIATRNLRNNVPPDIQDNIHTIHRLLEYEPDFKTVTDEKGNEKKVRIFIPTRNAMRPLPKELMAIFIDESSMVGLTLHANLVAAVNPKAQFIYIGDIAQLPPVMDSAILGFKLLELPVVELTQVYRHAGVIVNLANHIRVGNTVPESKDIFRWSANIRKIPKQVIEQGIAAWNKEEDGSKVTIHNWKNRLEGEVGQLRAMQNLDMLFRRHLDSGEYDPLKDMILMPYNKAVGTIEMNRYISQYLGKKRDAVVYEVIAGMFKHYFAVGDKVFYEREEAIITKINVNALYQGNKVPQLASVTLDRWGHNQAGNVKTTDQAEFDSIDSLLNLNVGDDDEERKNQASHTIYVKKIADMDDDGKEDSCSTASEVNGLLFGYALTIHKSQGSQWRKVYCVFHNSHNRNIQRELLYTAITRAQKELYVICEPETFIQGVLSQHIIGNTLAEKAEYFKGKKIENDKRDSLFNQNTGE